MVNTPQSTPALWAPGSDVASFVGYITFVGFNITYRPYNPQFVGTTRACWGQRWPAKRLSEHPGAGGPLVVPEQWRVCGEQD